MNHAYAVREKYGLDPGFSLDPPSGELNERRRRTSQVFDAVLQHVDEVDLHVHHNYVVLHRDACAPPNTLFKRQTLTRTTARRASGTRFRSYRMRSLVYLSATPIV